LKAARYQPKGVQEKEQHPVVKFEVHWASKMLQEYIADIAERDTVSMGFQDVFMVFCEFFFLNLASEASVDQTKGDSAEASLSRSYLVIERILGSLAPDLIQTLKSSSIGSC